MTRINGWACFFLVTLRLVIGWHFFIEGMHKIHTHRVGKTSSNTPWTSEGFFREGYGSATRYAGEVIRDGQFGYRFVDSFRAAGTEPPALLNLEWLNYFVTFCENSLSIEQRKDAKEKFAAEQTKLQAWLNGDEATLVKKNLSWGTVELKLTAPQLLKEYDEKVREITDIHTRKLPAFNKDVEKTRLRNLKTEAAKIISDLNAEFNHRTAEMKAALSSVLTDEQSKQFTEPPDVLPPSAFAQIDKATMWSHTILGGLLLLGLFTRLSSLALAIFLLLVTLITPAVPWAPTPPGSTGHYLYINLYTIEMIALLALAFLPTGKWFGVDALFVRRPRPIANAQ